MLPFNSGFDLSRLNALRQIIYGGGAPMPFRGGPMLPAAGTGEGTQPVWGGNPPVSTFPVHLGGSPPVQGGPMQPGGFPNLMALRSLAPQGFAPQQNQMRFPMARQF